MTISFIDSGVLIAAARGEGIIAEKALDILKNPDLELASSFYVKMEVLPKAIFYQNNNEVEFYQTFFSLVSYWANDEEKIRQIAYEEASKFGLSAMDSLHIAAAISVNADDFITTEKINKPIHRTKSIKLISIYPE